MSKQNGKRWAYYIENWCSKEWRKKGNGKFCRPFPLIHSVLKTGPGVLVEDGE